MELQLFRIDYAIVGVTNRNCIKLFRTGADEPQKIAIGDNEGILQVFSIRKDYVQMLFKTLPGLPIVSVKIARTGSNSYDDKILIACGNEISGYTKKGKLFLTLNLGLTEPVNAMYVLDNDLFICGKHTYNHFRDYKDIGSYLCGDTIVDVIAFYMKKTNRLISLIACESRMIRILEHARLTCSIEIENSPTILHLLTENHPNSTNIVLFGTIDGKIGMLDIENVHGFDRWLITNEKNSSPISCIDSYNLTANEHKNLILGRQDGNVEIYHINVFDERDVSYLIFVECCNESISSMQCGIVQQHPEILIVTYSGRLFGLKTQVSDANRDGPTGNHIFTNDTSAKINKLKLETEELKRKLIKEREQYQSSTQSINGLMELSAIPPTPINTFFIFEKETATYILTIEMPTAIDNILIRCNFMVNLLDVGKNTAIISYSEDNSSNANLLATYRCQTNTNRIELELQTSEGEFGELQAYVSPALQPKCSRLLNFNIKALSLHYRIYECINEEDCNRPLNELNVKGSFSFAEIHAWIVSCLPEVPEKTPIIITEQTVLYYQSSLVGSVLLCSYQKGTAKFKSDNISTLFIIKTILTIETTKKKTKIEINIDIKDDSIYYLFTNIEPKLALHKKMIKEKELIEALDKLEIKEKENFESLSPKYQDLLKRRMEIISHFKVYPNYLKRLSDSILNLYINYTHLKGLNCSRQILKEIENNLNLDDFCYTKLIEIFKSVE